VYGDWEPYNGDFEYMTSLYVTNSQMTEYYVQDINVAGGWGLVAAADINGYT
jgi:hypothetical protein